MMKDIKDPMDRILKARRDGTMLKNSIQIIQDTWKVQRAWSAMQKRFPGMNNMRDKLSTDPYFQKAQNAGSFKDMFDIMRNMPSETKQRYSKENLQEMMRGNSL